MPPDLELSIDFGEDADDQRNLFRRVSTFDSETDKFSGDSHDSEYDGFEAFRSSSLCSKCSKIGLGAAFLTAGTYMTRTLADLRSTPDCALCRLVEHAYDSRSSLVSDKAKHRAEVQLLSSVSDDEIQISMYSRPFLGDGVEQHHQYYRLYLTYLCLTPAGSDDPTTFAGLDLVDGPYHMLMADRSFSTSWDEVGMYARSSERPSLLIGDSSLVSRRLFGPFIDVELIQSWLSDYHSTSQYRPYGMNVRSADMTPGFDLRIPIVCGDLWLINVTTKRVEQATKMEAYVALSYVWGPRATARRIYHPGDFLEMADLPRTIHDAINLTQCLGLRYVWIDAICIDQSKVSSVSASHGSPLIQSMGAVYANAVLAVVAASGAHADAGLPGIGHARTSVPRICRVGERAKLRPLVLTLSLPPVQLLLSTEALPWKRRGWTFQEGMLSKRILYLTDSEAIYQDRKTVKRESCLVGAVTYRGWDSTIAASGELDSDVKEQPYFQSLLEVEPGDFLQYAHAVFDYTRRSLSFESDILKAFAGVLRQFYQECPGALSIYYHGLPFHLFQRALCWTAAEHSAGPLLREGLPSWSWAAQRRNISYPYLGSDQPKGFNFEFDKTTERIIGRCIAKTPRSYVPTSFNPEQWLTMTPPPSYGSSITCPQVVLYTVYVKTWTTVSNFSVRITRSSYPTDEPPVIVSPRTSPAEWAQVDDGASWQTFILWTFNDDESIAYMLLVEMSDFSAKRKAICTMTTEQFRHLVRCNPRADWGWITVR